MKKFWLLLLLAGYAPGLFATDPPYFVEPVEGYFIPDLVNRGKFEFIPGNLVDCKVYSSPTYSNWECKVDSAEVKVVHEGKTMRYPVNTLYVYEYQYDPKEPSNISYSFSGPYTETLPDGSSMSTTVAFSFDRQGKEPKKLRGRLYLGINVGSSVFAELK